MKPAFFSDFFFYKTLIFSDLFMKFAIILRSFDKFCDYFAFLFSKFSGIFPFLRKSWLFHPFWRKLQLFDHFLIKIVVVSWSFDKISSCFAIFWQHLWFFYDLLMKLAILPWSLAKCAVNSRTPFERTKFVVFSPL